MVRLLAITITLVLASAALQADVLILANNDRISGKFEREEDGMIVFTSPVLGELRISNELARLEPVAAQPRLDASFRFKPLDIRAAARDPGQALKAERIGWVRRMEFGFTSQSGRADKADLALNFEAGRRGKRSEARFLARYLWGESENEATSDLAESSLRLRRSLSDKTFLQSSTKLTRDLIKEIDLDGEQGFGLGRNVLNSDTAILAFGAGAASRYREQANEPAEWDYLVDCFQDLRYEINKRLSLVQDLSVVVAPANQDDYKLRLNTALTGKVTEAFNMTMRYEYEYDRSLDLDLRANQRVVTALVYVF